jgi:hypothetical protein
MNVDRIVPQNPAPQAHVDFDIPEIPTEGLRVIQVRMEEQRLAYLDRDAQKLANFVVERLSSAIPPDQTTTP